jgi:cytochrome c-type biogenesis protein CcmH/NrfF
MAEVLLWVSLALVLVVVALMAYASHRRHRRRAQARSRAALNRLLAEADEISQSGQREQGDDPPAT